MAQPKSPEDAVLGSRRTAAALLEVEAWTEKRERAIVEEMTSRYRAGRLDHDFVVGRVAELSAGRHLVSEMRRSLTQEITNV